MKQILFTFQEPLWLWGLPLAWGLQILVEILIHRRRNDHAVLFPALAEVKEAAGGRRRRIGGPILRALGIALVFLALARPESGIRSEARPGEGVDLVICLDLSASMKGEDFGGRTRLSEAKRLAAEFVERRDGDRIALVTFGSEALVNVPLTLDHAPLRQAIDRLAIRPDREEGTETGLALGTALLALRSSKAKGKAVIFLSDGANNGRIADPETAIAVARQTGVRVHAVGIGKPGRHDVFVTVLDPALGERKETRTVEMDEAFLRQLGSKTGGIYRNARDGRALGAVFREIDRLEKSDLAGRPLLRSARLDAIPGLLALIVFLASSVLHRTRWKTLP